MPVEKKIKYPLRKAKTLSPKLAEIVRLAQGGTVEEGKPKTKPPSNVIPFPVKPGTEADWMKTAVKEDYLELLNKLHDSKKLNDLSEEELKELLDYYILTGAIG
jgi:hypothetical protein